MALDFDLDWVGKERKATGKQAGHGKSGFYLNREAIHAGHQGRLGIRQIRKTVCKVPLQLSGADRQTDRQLLGSIFEHLWAPAWALDQDEV